MEAYENEIVDLNLNTRKLIKRRNLLPWWIKVFCWIFMIFGVIAPFGLVLGITGAKFQISLYGIETYDPLSIAGLGLLAIIAFKALAAFGLWSEKSWAVKIAQWDAIVGIVLCVFVMIIMPFFRSGFVLSLRLELILLIPYLLKLNKIKEDWEEGRSV